jgi:hypothetical protein
LWQLATGRVLTRDDLAAMHLPFRYLYQQALRSGDTFLWTPALHSGLYLHGEGEAGMAHPLHLALYRFLPLASAFNLEIVSSYLTLLAGTFWLWRRVGLAADASLFGAMLFAFSGFTLFNLAHVNHIATIAHAPLLLAATHALLSAPTRRSRTSATVLIACIAGSQWLVGNPQYVWFTYLALAYVAGVMVIGGAPASRLPWLAGALALGLLIGAVQLLPTWEFARASVRTGWTLDERLSFSLAPINLVQLWSPFAFRFRVYAPEAESQIVHEFIVYNGAFCTIALAWIACRWRTQRRVALLTALIVGAAIALVLAFGRYGGVYPLIANLPGIQNFRAPARHLVLFDLALSGIAAVAFEDLMAMARRTATERSAAIVPLAITAVLTVGITIVAVLAASTTWTRALPWACVILAMIALVGLTSRGVTWAAPALVLLTAIDLGVWGYSYIYRWSALRTVSELAADATVPPDGRAGQRIVPMPADPQHPANLPIFRGFTLTTGYAGPDPASVLPPDDPLSERLAGAAWRPSGTQWVPVADPMPRARLMSDARTSRDVETELRATDIRRTVLSDRRVGGLSGSPGEAQVVTDRPGRIVIETNGSGPQVLVVAERFHEGWRAAQDGTTRDTIRAYGDFLGVVVDPGRHSVTLTFAPASIRRGMLATLIGISLMAAVAVVAWYPPTRNAATHETVRA